MSKWWIGFLALSLALLVNAAWSPRPAAVGAPWVSLEIPANPMDQSARDAVMFVHAYLHGNPAGYRVKGTAEGLVDGERRSIPLEFTRTSRPNVYALKQQWPSKGDWLLKIGIEESGEISLLVELGPDGGVSDGTFYEFAAKTLALRSVKTVSGQVGTARIDAVLRQLARNSSD